MKGVSFEALESVLLSINPWSTDDYFLEILLSMVATIDTKIDAGVVRALRPLPRAYRRLAYELFFSIVSKLDGADEEPEVFSEPSSVASPLHCQNNIPLHFDNNFFLDKEIKFILEQGVKNIPNISALWGPAFGAARYRWLAKFHLKVNSVSDTFAAVLLSTDWSKSNIPERSFRDLIQLFEKKDMPFAPISGVPYELSFTLKQFLKLVSSFSTETVTSNWTCLLRLLKHVSIPQSDADSDLEIVKERNFLGTFEMVCKKSDTATDNWKCATSVMSMFALAATFFERDVPFDTELEKKFKDCSETNPNGPESRILNQIEYSQKNKIINLS